MSEPRLSTRREVLGSVLGLAVGGVTPGALHGLQDDGPMPAQGDQSPYRYAGKLWWTGGYKLAGINPDIDEATGAEAGFEEYLSVQYKRFPKKYPGQEAPTTLPGDNSYGIVAGPGGALYLAEVFNRWAQDMTAWAKAVREDLKALEAAIGKREGDPGDPPPVPWK